LLLQTYSLVHSPLILGAHTQQLILPLQLHEAEQQVLPIRMQELQERLATLQAKESEYQARYSELARAMAAQ
jgi:hypothetical protein